MHCDRNFDAYKYNFKKIINAAIHDMFKGQLQWIPKISGHVEGYPTAHARDVSQNKSLARKH